jgi:hypothetical protein
MDKLGTFRKEINFIKDPSLKEFAELAIQTLPDYFFTMPSSTTGKYHAQFALGEGGLVRHTKAAMRIAVELFCLEMFDYFTPKDKDVILVSLLLHDGYKKGDGSTDFTVTEHPIFAAKAIRENPVLDFIIEDDLRNMICDNIKSHMGQYAYNKANIQVLEKPQNKMQSFVHLMDFLSSRRMIEINFDAEISRH